MPDRSDFDRLFGELYRQHCAFVRFVLVRFGIHPSDLDDVAQEVFIAVLKKLPDFEHRSDIKTWIFTICRHKASEHRRRAHRRYELPVAEPVAPCATFEPQQDELQRRSDSELLDLALSRLSAIQRKVFVRRVIEGESVAAIANDLGCSQYTVYARIKFAARKMQTFVGRRCGLSAWLLLTARSGDGRRTAGELGASADALPKSAWFRPPLEWVLASVAGVCVIMSPLPSDSPGAGAPARSAEPLAKLASGESSAPPAIEALAIEPPAPQVAPTQADDARQPAPRKQTSHPRRARRVQVEAAAMHEPEQAPAPPPPRPEQEQEILWRSRLSLDTNPRKALELTEEHAALHPAGLHVEDREALAIEALLRLRREDTALARAEHFVAAYPVSPYARPVRQLIERLASRPPDLAVADSR